MSSHYAQGLELVARVQEQVNDIKPDAINHRATVQRWYALGQNWNLLRAALVATGEAADKVVTASKQQRARRRNLTAIATSSANLRTRHADACLWQFRYVTTLSNHARAVRQHHESKLFSLGNLQDHYEEALGPQADIVHSHQTFLDALGRKIEAVKRTQGLEMVFVRWIQLRAAADLKRKAKLFHFTCERLVVRKKRAEKARKLEKCFQQKTAQCVMEYEHLETEVLGVQNSIRDLWNTSVGSKGKDRPVSGPAQDENADHMAQGV